jgi:FKBP-type peptidyl-prolyl cis-trans isomerase FklB
MNIRKLLVLALLISSYSYASESSSSTDSSNDTPVVSDQGSVSLDDSQDKNVDSKKGDSMTNDMNVKDENTSFLESTAKQPGVVKTNSGLLYKVLQSGSGAHPSINSMVTVNYEGRLPNGKIFDSSYQRGTPASFGVSDVISGWTEALQLMTPGSTWELYIPANLAYGERGVPGVIAPNSVLVFKVELLQVS